MLETSACPVSATHHMASLCSFSIFFFLIFLFFSTLQGRADGQSEFNFTDISPNDILLQGGANTVSNGNGTYISLTQWSYLKVAHWAWATYNKALPLWTNSGSSHVLANFATDFVFDISQNGGIVFGGGLTFFMAPFDMEPPVNRGEQWLGLFNSTSDGNFSNQIVAVEFDTFKNAFDMDDNHVGINVNSIVSKVNVSVSNGHPKDGEVWHVWVDYHGAAKKLQVFLSKETFVSWFPGMQGKPTTPILSYDIDLSQFLPQNVQIGFSASSELDSNEWHNVYHWEFSSQHSWEINTRSKNQVNSRNKKRNVNPLFVEACAAVVVTAMVCLVLLLARFRHGNTNKLKSRELDKHCSQGPRKFSYSVLRAATKNFSNDETLGKGGFGQVYRGFLSASNETVAVKRGSQGSKQGEKEYISEVSIISKLRHRNLVQLHGWCHEKSRLLLVYEYLPNGSLDKYLFGEQRKGDLNWERRYSITCDIASALLYLHEEWDQRVVHRDIKASNIMLDGEFIAKLGDFGLARIVERERAVSDTTVVAGTLGYLAPEYVVTRKASLESDVFSFGAVCLEIACGRRAVDRNLDDHNWRLVEWIWDLYGKGKILDAADAMLGRNFNSEEMERVLLVGLMCSHPDPKARLSIRRVIDILKMKALVPPLPPRYPETVYMTSYGSILALSFMSDRTFYTAQNACNIEYV